MQEYFSRTSHVAQHVKMQTTKTQSWFFILLASDNTFNSTRGMLMYPARLARKFKLEITKHLAGNVDRCLEKGYSHIFLPWLQP